MSDPANEAANAARRAERRVSKVPNVVLAGQRIAVELFDEHGSEVGLTATKPAEADADALDVAPPELPLGVSIVRSVHGHEYGLVVANDGRVVRDGESRIERQQIVVDHHATAHLEKTAGARARL